jgi:hypothetical protein
MNVFSSLETTAEISVTFAGFISIFMVLARRDESFASEIAALIRFILLGSITCLFLAAVPLVAGGIGLTGKALWSLASSLGLAAGLGMGLFASSQRRDLGDREVTGFARLAWVLASLAVLSFLANIIGWPLSPNGGVHLAGVWLGLAIPSVNLVDLVFRFALKPPAA